MDRLFWKFYAKLLAGLALALLGTATVVAPRVDAQTRNNIEASMATPVGLVSQLLADEHARGMDIDASFARASTQLRGPSALIADTDPEVTALDQAAHARVDRGEVVRTGDAFTSVVFSRIEGTNRLVRVGPYRMPHPLGGGRSLAILALVATGLFASVHLVLSPIRTRLTALANATAGFGAGDLTRRVAVKSDDAIGRVATAFNRMADDVQRTIAAQRELLQMVSHDIRTPLQRIQFNVENLRTATEDAARAKAMAGLDRDVDELDALLSELLSFVRLGERRAPERTAVDVSAVLEEVCATMVTDKVSLTFRRSDAPLTMSLDRRLVARAVTNLVANALTFAGSRVEVSAELDAERRELVVHVDDDGPGIAPADRDRVFEPFSTSAPDRERGRSHFGLGLAIVRRVADLHGGRAEALASPLGGARLDLVLTAGARE